MAACFLLPSQNLQKDFPNFYLLYLANLGCIGYRSATVMRKTFLIACFTLLLTGSFATAKHPHEYAPLTKVDLSIPEDFHFLYFPMGKALEFRTAKISDLRKAKGTKILLLSFFAPWCENCNYEAPFLNKLHKQFSKKGLKIVAINEYGHPTDTKKYLKKFKPPFPVLVESWNTDDPTRQGTLHYRLRKKLGDKRKWGTPFNVFLLKDSSTKYVVMGEMIEDEILQWLKSTLP